MIKGQVMRRSYIIRHCSVKGCDQEYGALGLCKYHYTKERSAMPEQKLIQLKKWLSKQRIVSTVQIKEWGNKNFFTSADVRCRELARQGFLESLSRQEAILMGLLRRGQQLVRWYRVIGA